MADYTIPTGYWQQHDVYKRASNAAKEKMRRHYIEMQAIGMPDKVEKNILRAAKQHPTMSPGVISSLANSFETLENLDDILAYSNEKLNERVNWANAGYVDTASLAAQSELGATPANPLPQTPNPLTTPTPATAQVPNPEEDPEQSHNWLTNLFGADSYLANKLTELLGSPSEQDPDPNTWDFVKATPRVFFGNVMNLMMTGIDMYNAQGRQYAGKYAKAYEVARRNGIQVDNVHDLEQVFPDLADDGEGVLDKVYTLRAIPGLSKLRDDMLLAGVKDESVPVGTGSVEQARQEFADYRTNVQADGGIWNSVDIYRNFKAGTLAQTPWFGGEANNQDGVLGKEEYAGTVYDINTWDDEQKIRKDLELRAAEMNRQGAHITAEEVDKMYTPRPWTQGRALAGSLDLDPESHAYSIVSGAIDFGIALGADPLTYVPGAAFTKPVKVGVRAASKPVAKTLGTNKAFEADLLMSKARKGAVQQLRPILDELGLSNVLRPKVHWERGSRGLDWVDDGTGTLKPTYGDTKVKMKGATVKTVETREFSDGSFMFKRGKGWGCLHGGRLCGAVPHEQ